MELSKQFFIQVPDFPGGNELLIRPVFATTNFKLIS